MTVSNEPSAPGRQAARSARSTRSARSALAVRALALLAGGAAPLLAGGCRTPAVPPEGAVPREMYQRVANALPQASFGWGSRPGIVDMSASARAEGPPPPADPPVANERGFRLVVDVYRPRAVTIPYAAIEQVFYGWRPVPNALLAPLLVVPLQLWRTTVVFDALKVDGFLAGIEHDVHRLEQISREVGLGGPWSFAQDVKEKLADDAAEFGADRVSVHFDAWSPLPAWLPRSAPAQRLAEPFAWCQAHPDERVAPNPPPEGSGSGPADVRAGPR